MVNVYITNNDNSLIIRTIPLTIVSTECFRLTSVDNAHQTDRQTIAILLALIEFRESTLQHELLTYHTHAILVVNHIALILDGLGGKRDAIAPILQDEHT